MQVGDEVLQCAMAKCDAIPALKMFRGHCKPIWLFIVAGTALHCTVTEMAWRQGRRWR